MRTVGGTLHATEYSVTPLRQAILNKSSLNCSNTRVRIALWCGRHCTWVQRDCGSHTHYDLNRVASHAFRLVSAIPPQIKARPRRSFGRCRETVRRTDTPCVVVLQSRSQTTRKNSKVFPLAWTGVVFKSSATHRADDLLCTVPVAVLLGLLAIRRAACMAVNRLDTSHV